MELFTKLMPRILWMALTMGYAVKAEMSVQSSSEGTDCRCKCILTTKDGGPCEEGPRGARKTVYSVETISGGSDCRCSCNTPPPSGCLELPREVNVVQPFGEDLDEIDLVELHGSISSMVSAMVKLEKAVAKTKSKSQEETMRENVNKVVLDLKSTNGSYKDELKDFGLDLNDETERTTAISSATADDDLVVPSLKTLTTARSEATETRSAEQGETKPRDAIGVVPMDRPMPSSGSVSPSVTSSTSQATVYSSTSPDAEEETTQDTVVEKFPLDAVTTTEALLNNNATTKHTLNATTSESVASSPLPPIQPRILFKPYRAVKTPESRKHKEESRHQGVAYDYFDDFDIGVVTRKSTKGSSVTPISTMTSPVTSPPTRQNNATTFSTTTAEQDESYADHLTEYEYDYDYDDENHETTSTSTTTTTAATTTRFIDPCGTLYSISRPMVMSHFGRREGAWMRDPVPSKTDPARSRKVYIANFYYGNNLIEFDGIESVRRLRYRNFYNLPHKWSGTGHIVYNGSFYYNRAFSTTLIKYNLKYRFVSAWTRLANVVYNTRSPLTWKGHTGVHLAADEVGLWAVFPSQDPYDPHSKMTYIVNKINSVDLRVLESYKTKIRHPVSHMFMICGILYTTDRYNSRRARVNNAFDTRTLSQRNSYLGFENLFSYAVQFSYNPNEKKIYAWDNGRQVEYRVGLMH